MSSWNVDIPSSVSAPRLFKAFVLDWHVLGPKVFPEIVAGGKAGKPEVGSIRELNFTSALPFSYVKERLEFLDVDKFESKASVVEGGSIGETLESANRYFKVEPKADGGCIFKAEVHFKPLPGANADEEITKGKETLIGAIKAAEAYLQANPEAYA